MALSGEDGYLRRYDMKSIGDVRFGKAIGSINALNRIKAFKNRGVLSTAIAATLLVTMSACADGNVLQIAVIGPLSGIDINEISDIDPRKGTFNADFYL